MFLIFFFTGLLQSHDLVHVFDRLTRFNLIHLTRSFFFIDINYLSIVYYLM
jgi:hypothetical protein